MKAMTVSELAQLLSPQKAPCISLYLPTHRHEPNIDRDRLRFRALVGQAKDLLETRSGSREAEALLEPVRALDDTAFWRARDTGLAVFRTSKSLDVYRLPLAVPELAVVADTFHTKPLVRYLSHNQRYWVVALSLNAIGLYQGTPFGLSRAEIPEGSMPTFQGSGPSGEERKEELVRHFRAVDQELKRILADEHAPIVLAGVGYLHPIYREVTKLTSVLDDGVDGNVERSTPEEIHDKAWPLVKSVIEVEERARIDELMAMTARGRGSTDVATVANAVVHGRVRHLLVAEGEHVWGRIDEVTGDVQLEPEQKDSTDADLLDDLAEMTLLRGGQVLVLPAGKLPTGTALGAIFRY